MKKVLGVFVVGLALGFLSFGAAQKFGVYTGYPGGIGGHYFMGDMRVSVGIPFFYGFGVDASLDMIMGRGMMDMSMENPFSYYYGGGVGGSFYSVVGVSVMSVYPHMLAGLEFDLPGSNMSVFSEVNVGPMFSFGSLFGGFAVGYGGKVGVNFR